MPELDFMGALAPLYLYCERWVGGIEVHLVVAVAVTGGREAIGAVLCTPVMEACLSVDLVDLLTVVGTSNIEDFVWALRINSKLRFMAVLLTNAMTCVVVAPTLHVGLLCRAVALVAVLHHLRFALL
jgi:hypothetical protein